MSETASKARTKQTRNALTSRGIYDKQRSKHVRGKDGYGKVISVALKNL